MEKLYFIKSIVISSRSVAKGSKATTFIDLTHDDSNPVITVIPPKKNSVTEDETEELVGKPSPFEEQERLQASLQSSAHTGTMIRMGKSMKLSRERALKKETERLRDQQLKIFHAIRDHERALKTLREREPTVHTKITDSVVPVSEMKLVKPSAQDLKLLRMPAAYEPFDAVDPQNYQIVGVRNGFQKFIEKEENSHPNPGLYKDKKEKTPVLKVIDLRKVGLMKCEGCGNIMTECHDVLYGPFCVYVVIRYATVSTAFDADKIV